MCSFLPGDHDFYRYPSAVLFIEAAAENQWTHSETSE